MIIDFRKREGEGREKERKRNIDVTEKNQSIVSCMCPDPGQNPQPRYAP